MQEVYKDGRFGQIRDFDADEMKEQLKNRLVDHMRVFSSPAKEHGIGGCRCCNCGKQYKIDLNINDDLWAKISPRGNDSGLLCGSCIINKLEEMNLFGYINVEFTNHTMERRKRGVI